jgi:maleylpyruvate isomerase
MSARSADPADLLQSARPVRLYGYWRSSSAWRVRIGLSHKGVAFENVPVNLAPTSSAQHAPSYRAVNPMAQVPVLELADGRRLTQSLAILELLDELRPSPPLLPRDPWARGQARMLAEIVNSGTQPLQNLDVLQKLKALGADEQAWARDVIARGLAALESAAQASAGRHLVGDDVSLADVLLVPQLFNARRFQVALDPYPTLVAIEARCQALPAFAETHPDRMPDAVRPSPAV